MEQESKLKAIVNRLSARERRLLVVWVIAMAAIVVFIVSVKINGAIQERREGIATYQAALTLIAERQDEYLLAKSGGGPSAKPLKERIDTNEIKLQTYLDKEAMRFDLKINNFKEQSLPVGGKRSGKKKAPEGSLIEESVTIEIENADYKKFAEFVDKIHRSPELLVVKRIQVQKPRRLEPNSPHQVRVTMTISTYKKAAS